MRRIWGGGTALSNSVGSSDSDHHVQSRPGSEGRNATSANGFSGRLSSRSVTDPTAAARRNGLVKPPPGDLHDDADMLPFSSSFSSSSSRPWALTPVSEGPSSASSTTDSKEDLILELLSGQALLEARDWKPLEWDVAEDLKKESAKLKVRIASLGHRYALEVKMREASRRVAAGSLPKYGGAEAEDDQRVEAVLSALTKAKERRSDIQEALLRHTSALLARIVKRHDEIAGGMSPVANVSRQQPRRPLDSFVPFEGPHLFANHRDAVIPSPSILSPRLVQSPPPDLTRDRLEAEMRSRHVQELEDVRSELKTRHEFELESLSSEHDAELDRVRSQHAEEMRRQKLEHESSSDEGRLNLEREVRSLQSDHRRALEDLETRHEEEREQFVREREDLLDRVSKSGKEASAHLDSLQSFRAEAERFRSRTEGTEADLSRAKFEADDLRRQLEEVRRLHEQGDSTREAELKSLAGVWRLLPSSEARSRIGNGDDLKSFRSAFAPTPSGNFTEDLARQGKFSVPDLVERVRRLAADDTKLVDRLMRYEAERDDQVAAAESAQRSLAENQKSLDEAIAQIGDLQSRMAKASNQEGSLLEKLNELQSASESLRIENRRLEIVASEARSLADGAESEINELKAQLVDAQDDLDDFKGREQKQRINLLDELNTAQQEISTLRSQLRKLQREKPGAR